jgi:hypothetical protein
MKLLLKITLAAAAVAAEPVAVQKNWTASTLEILARTLVNDVMARHPER